MLYNFRKNLKVTDLRWRSPICSFLRFSAKIFGFSAKICSFLWFPAPSTCLNFQEKGWICENLRFSAKICVLGALCHLSSVPLSSPLKLGNFSINSLNWPIGEGVAIYIYIYIYMPPGSFAAANFSIVWNFVSIRDKIQVNWPMTLNPQKGRDSRSSLQELRSKLSFTPKKGHDSRSSLQELRNPSQFCAQMLVFKGFEAATQGFGWPFLAHFGGVCRFGQKWASHYIAPYTRWALFGRGGSNLSFGGGGGWVRCIKTFFFKGFWPKRAILPAEWRLWPPN